MGYRKFKADYLFTGLEMLDHNSVLVTTAEGKIIDVIPASEAGENIQYFPGLLSPGFINTHCHLELSHMKGVIPQGTGLVEFLTTVIKKRNFQTGVILEAMKVAETAIYRTGTVAVGDICNTTDSIPVKNESCIYWQNFIEVIGFAKQPEDRFAYALKLLDVFEKQIPPRHSSAAVSKHASLSPHAPYSVSEELFHMINEHSGVIMTIHNQETEAENKLYVDGTGEMFSLYRNLNIDASFFKKTGKTSIQTYLPWLFKPLKLILVHNSFSSEADMEFINQQLKLTSQQIFFSVCIKANRYIENRNPPLNVLKKANVMLTIGTDSYASNETLDIVEEMKTIHLQFPGAFSLEEVLGWATINGAHALQINDWAGSFEKDKKPGIVWINNVSENKLSASSSSKRIL